MARFNIQSYALAGLVLATTVKAELNHEEYHKMLLAHGVMMGVAFGILFPMGAIVLRMFNFKGLIWFHAGWQILAYIISLAAFGLGVWMAVVSDKLVTSNGHAIIGIIVIGALFLQPFGGYLAHKLFVQKQHATLVHIIHRWIGRIFLILGAINGGLGLQLAGESGYQNPWKANIAYGVLTGVFFALWLAVCVYDYFKAEKSGKPDLHGENLEQQQQQQHIDSAGESAEEEEKKGSIDETSFTSRYPSTVITESAAPQIPEYRV